jgi:hypothetical protein
MIHDRLVKRPAEFAQADGFANRHQCEHAWQPVSFVFETELLTVQNGEIQPAIRQPDLHNGRVYCVCMKCASHTYIATQWINYYLGGDHPAKKTAREETPEEK